MLQQVNEYASREFESSEGALEEALTVMNQLLLPCMALLGSQPCPHDQSVVEEVRDKWCNFLSMELPGTWITWSPHDVTALARFVTLGTTLEEIAL